MNMKNKNEQMGRRDFLLRSAGALALCHLPVGLSSCAVSGSNPATTASSQQALYWSWWGWEPLDHYLRTGGVVGAVDTKSPWLKQWYDRLHSEEVVRMMADMGVNLGVTHFFKGFGLVHERAEQQNTARLVKFAHKHGVKILGYCQSRSLYHEQFLAEVPTAEDWIQRDGKGQLQFWGGAKFRWAPCIHSAEFRAYMKRAITVGLKEIDLDGLHFDNNYAPPCYCKRCEQKFREWLTKRHPKPQQRFGRSSFDEVKQPATEKNLTRISDPIIQEWVRWRCESLAEYQADLEAHARRLKPDVILLGNPAFPRRPNGAYTNSVWAPWQGRHLDLLFAENGNFPGIEDGALISQVRASKYGHAIGYRVISTTWKHDKLTGLGLPDNSEVVGLQIAEAAANGALPGTNWALRPLGERDRMRVERPDMREALANHLRFVRTHEPLWHNVKPARDVALLQTFASAVFDTQEASSFVSGAEEILIRGGFAWEVLFDEQLDRLTGFSVLVLAGQSHLSNRQVQAIRKFATQGGSLVLAGNNGRYDETGRERPAPVFDDLRAERVEPETVRASASGTYAQRVVLPKEWRKFAAALERAAGNRFSARLSGADTVTLNAYECGKNKLAVHLVNYATSETPAELSLELGRRWKKARFLTPDAPERVLTVQSRIEIPPFKIYAIVVFE
ncbi:MAG: hypothetical protein FJ395_07310 [Verrucomicrobia bacterium]|nr:hypothetical protein [Verrucomicrobiota bacterium]